MNLFFFKPKKVKLLLIIIIKISTIEEFNKIEEITNNIFQILMDNNDATEENILIFSIIKDYNKTITNLILPSTKSSIKLIHRCHTDMRFTNAIIIDTLKNSDTEYYLELVDEYTKCIKHTLHLNLMSLSQYY